MVPTKKFSPEEFFVNYAAFPYQSLNFKGLLVSVNDEWLKKLGYKKKEVIGHEFSEFLEPNDAVSFQHKFSEFVRKGKLFDCTVKIRKRSGGYLDVCFSGKIEGEGATLRSHCFFVDQTEILSYKEELERLRRVINLSERASKIGYFVYDLADGSIIVSDTNKNLFGMKKNSYPSLSPFFSRIPPADRQKLKDAVQDIVKGIEKKLYVHFCIRKDSETRHLLTQGQVFDTSTGRKIFGTSQDITVENHKKQKLALEKKKWQAIFNQAFHFQGVLDTDGILIEANKTALDLIGRPSSEVLGKPFWLTPWWTHDIKMQNKLKKAIKEAKRGFATRVEVTHKDKSGRIHIVDFSLRPVFDDSGKLAYLIPEGKDITHRVLSERNLKEEKDKFMALFRSMYSGVAVYVPKDNDFEIVNWNNTAERITKKKRSEVIGRKVTEVFPGVKQMGLFNVFRKVAKTGKPAYFPTTEYADKELKAWYENNVYKLPNGEIVAVFIDRTKQKLAEQSLLTAFENLKSMDKMKSTLLRDVSHELKTPSALLTLASRLLEEEVNSKDPSADKIKKYAAMIQRNAQVFNEQLTMVVEFSRLQNIENLKKVNVDITKLLKALFKEYQKVAEFKRLGFVNECKASCRIKGSKQNIETMFRNLIVNALKFTEHGKITLGCQRSDDKIVIQITDTGRGISPGFQEKLYSAFSQEDPSIEGMGLGLAICKKIAELHQARIDIESKQNKGTVVRVEFNR